MIYFSSKCSLYTYKMERLILSTKCPEEGDCAICLTELKQTNAVYLPCKHIFHQKCFNQSVRNNLYSCALCRHDLRRALSKIPAGAGIAGLDLDLDLDLGLAGADIYNVIFDMLFDYVPLQPSAQQASRRILQIDFITYPWS